MMKKTIRSLAAFLLLCAMLSACGSDAPDAPSTSDVSDTTTVETTSPYADEVPALDFGGASFRTIEQESTEHSFYTAEEVGEVVMDAIYRRNREIEERFNVVFEETKRIQYAQLSKLVEQSVLSGTDEYDLVFGQMFQSAKQATTGIFSDWNKVPYVDFTKPWYTKSIEQAAVGDKLFMIESDLCVMYTEQTWMMVYNQTKAASYKSIPDLYALVRDGKWTVDALNTIVADIYSDVNGNSQRDLEDFFGIGAEQGGCQVAAFVYGCGVNLAEIEEDLSLTHTVASERSIDALTKLAKLFNQTEGSISKSESFTFKGGTSHFCNGTILFSPMQVNDLIEAQMREFNDSYGVLPIPKYDETQEEYYTVVDGGANIMTIPATATDTQLEMIGAVTEAMSAASYEDVTPAYCEMALEQKGTRDEESIEMLRLILDSRIIDFAYLYDGFGGWVFKLPKMLASSDAIMSTIEANKTAVDAYYTGIIEYCAEK